jgi:hypothetical protein
VFELLRYLEPSKYRLALRDTIFGIEYRGKIVSPRVQFLAHPHNRFIDFHGGLRLICVPGSFTSEYAALAEF